MSQKKRKYVYGPVPSRRLGRSLGVDLVPFKVCPFDCTYCQVGRTTLHTDRRGAYLPADEVLAELREVLAAGVSPDDTRALTAQVGKLLEGRLVQVSAIQPQFAAALRACHEARVLTGLRALTTG